MRKLDVFNSKRFSILVLSILLFPVIFLNLSDYHNWGDDFAQYIDQARFFLNKRNNINTEVLNTENNVPIQRGEGFSLLISPIFLIFGLKIKYYLVYLSLFLILTGFLLFYYLKNYINNKALVLILVLIFVYNYNTINLKGEILTVFPFMFVLYLSINLKLNYSENLRFLFLNSLLTGFLISIWNLGYVLYFTYLIYYIYLNYKNLNLFRFFIILIIPILVDILIKKIIFINLSSVSIMWYEKVFTFTNLANNFSINIYYYKNIFKWYFEQEVWGFANQIIKYSILLFFTSGIIYKFYKSFDFIDLFFIIYIFTLLFYPYQGGGIRFVTPIIPIFLYYLFNGFFFLNNYFEIKHFQNFFIFSFFSCLLLSNYLNVRMIIDKKNQVVEGAQKKEAKEAFQYIKYHIKPEKSLMFSKPWVLHLYTNKISIFFSRIKDYKIFKKEVDKYGVDYVLLSSVILNKAIYQDYYFTKINKDKEFTLVWKNSSFNLYEKVN
jgi:hypothetical protein